MIGEEQASSLCNLARVVETWGCGAHIERLELLGVSLLRAEMCAGDGSRWVIGAGPRGSFPWDKWSVRCIRAARIRDTGEWLSLDCESFESAVILGDGKAEDAGWWEWAIVNPSGNVRAKRELRQLGRVSN